MLVFHFTNQNSSYKIQKFNFEESSEIAIQAESGWYTLSRTKINILPAYQLWNLVTTGW